MRQQNFRAVGWTTSAIVVWSSYLPMVSACDASGFLSARCSFSESTLIGLIIGGVILIFFIVILSAYVRRRRIRSRPTRIRRLSYGPCNVIEVNPQKPWNTPPAHSHPGYGQPSFPVPWPTQAPQYPPPIHDTPYSGHRLETSSQWWSPASLYAMPEPSTPASPLSTHPSSSAITSRPATLIDTTPASLRPAVQRDDTPQMRPQPSSTSLTARSSQNNIREAALSPVSSSPLTTVPESSSTPTSSPAPQSLHRIVSESSLPSAVTSPPPSRRPTVDVPIPASSPARRPSADVLRLNSSAPVVLSPMHTGATNNIMEPPPPYTPI